MKPSEAEELYGVDRWGAGYFSVGTDGRLRVHPTCDENVWVRLTDCIDELRSQRLRPPLVLRFPQMIAHRVDRLQSAFRSAIEEYGYRGSYRGVFPIKVNQTEAFVSGLVDAGRQRGYSLEAGTKPELLLALSSGLPRGSLIVCNGYKDAAYVELALAGTALGHEVVLVVEKPHELDLILKTAVRLGVEPRLGLRVRVHARGTGKWAKSGGDASKFGLSTDEVLATVKRLEDEDRLGWLRLLHFHIGSQVTQIRRIKHGVLEGARFYAALRARGVPIDTVDVGGGLGVDYDGSRTASDSSANYTVQEYANDIVWSIGEVCTADGVPHPDIVTESGRAVSAYHAMTLFTVEQSATARRAEAAAGAIVDPGPDADRCVRELIEVADEVGPRNFMESYHDTLALLDQLLLLFQHGHVSLEERAAGEAAARRVLQDVVYFAKTSGRRVPEEIEELQQDTARKYVCNFSVFESLPDHWAIGQLFPVCPLQRLDEKPTVWATIADITCDSDGKIAAFGGVREDQDAILLHELDGRPYHVGVFLLGAYQDVMGNHHNLLGETDEASVVVTGPGEADVGGRIQRGQDSGDVLEEFGHRRAGLRGRFNELVDESAAHGTDEATRKRALAAYRRVLNGTPYLTS